MLRWLPENVSTYGGDVDAIFSLIYAIVGVWFVLTYGAIIQDAMPGHSIALWFQATKAGMYPLPCAELCGFGHTGMMGRLVVHTPEEYEAWVKKLWPIPAAPQEQHEEQVEG
jgi:heme/copper-type cytochrome/quinol oxidase subunit 2